MRILFILLFSSVSLALFGQSKIESNNLDFQLNEMKQNYNLNDEQLEKVKFLLLDNQSEIDNIASLKKDNTNYSSERFKINKEFHTSLNEILTEQQKQEFLSAQRYSRTQKTKEMKNAKTSVISTSGERTNSTSSNKK